MAGIINLRQARKQRDRAARRAAGDGNAARHGEAPHVRTARLAEAARADQRLDGHRQVDHDNGPDSTSSRDTHDE